MISSCFPHQYIEKYWGWCIEKRQCKKENTIELVNTPWIGTLRWLKDTSRLFSEARNAKDSRIDPDKLLGARCSPSNPLIHDSCWGIVHERMFLVKLRVVKPRMELIVTRTMPPLKELSSSRNFVTLKQLPSVSGKVTNKLFLEI